MLMRKRAWDIVREDYLRVESDESLVDVMQKLLDCLKSGNGCLCALVFEGTNLLGAVSIWVAVSFMNTSLKESGLKKEMSEGDFEEMFHIACKLGVSTRVTEIMDKDFTLLEPDMPLMELMNKLIKRGRGYAVVKEGSQTLGVVMLNDVFMALAEEVNLKGAC